MIAPNPDNPHESIVEQWLARQQTLGAAERFAQQHAAEAPAAAGPAQRYRELMPAAAPGPGEQYAFDVDLDSCSGCKACVAACHNQNGLDDDEAWREVGLLVSPGRGGLSESANLPALQHVTTACHHCVEPACLEGCPVLAYDKDPVTGIVRHLDDQCIGCQYCVFKCPYDVPKYSKSRGIVRKCDMCSQRLANDEPPACAQSCPNEAIRIAVVRTDEAHRDGEAGRFLPGAPDPGYTKPTTRYRSKRGLPGDAQPADLLRIGPQHAHRPLVVMLVLTQLSVGALAVGQVVGEVAGAPQWAQLRPMHAVLSLAVGLLALAASVLHLGRPLYAFRAWIGLRTSWLSREIVAFGGFAALATMYAGSCAVSGRVPWLVHWQGVLGWAAAGAGAIGVFCSVMIYHDTRRDLWHLARSGPRFALSAAVLGGATTLLAAAVAAVVGGGAGLLGAWVALPIGVVIAGSALKLGLEAALLIHLRKKHPTPLKATAVLLTRELAQPTLVRFALGIAGGLVLPTVLMTVPAEREPGVWAAMAFGCFAMTLGGELIERWLFFASVAPPRMPGNPGAGGGP